MNPDDKQAILLHRRLPPRLKQALIDAPDRMHPLYATLELMKGRTEDDLLAEHQATI
jgi:hypothetical protein